MSDYWKYYHLSSDPFAADNPDITPYLSDRWQQQIDLLLHLSQSSNAVLVVTGVLGVGKSVLRHEFVREVKKEAGVCEVKGELSIVSSVLLQILASHLGINYQGMSDFDLKSAINQALDTMSSQGKRYVLVIDNAHKLPESTHETLLQFANDNAEPVNPLHIVLVGGPQLTATLSSITSETMGEALTHTQRVEALNRQETAQYIEHRLASVGVQSSNLFSEKDIDEIFKQSSGVPIKVNFFAKNILIKYLPQSETGLPKRTRFLRRHWPLAAGACVLLVLVTAFVVTPHNNPAFMQASQGEAALPSQRAALMAKQQSNTYTARLALASNTQLPTQATIETVTATTQTPVNPVVKVQETPTPTQSDAQSDEEEQAQIAARAEALTAANLPRQIPVTSEPKATQPQQVTQAATEPRGYTLQLLAAETINKANQFIINHGIEQQAHIYHVSSRGKIWYVVAYGQYNDSATAHLAVKDLPHNLQRIHPWIRSLKSINQNKVG